MEVLKWPGSTKHSTKVLKPCEVAMIPRNQLKSAPAGKQGGRSQIKVTGQSEKESKRPEKSKPNFFFYETVLRTAEASSYFVIRDDPGPTVRLKSDT